jgi:L-2-hydroxyglutarate oxidase
MHDYLVVGGGLVGLATTLKLLQRRRGLRVLLLEKELQVGQHQSTHNSGVLHCGLYYQPGSLKARLAVAGIQEMTAFCRANDIPHEICGKIVVAVTPDELPRLDELLRRGAANGLTGLERLDASQLRAIEPHVAGIAATRVPQEGIVDYAAVCTALQTRIAERGGQVVTGARVVRLRRANSHWQVATAAGAEYPARFLINCAGLHCDRVSQLAGEKRAVRIVPFRGEYYELRTDRRPLVRNLIYPVPNPEFPFLGVHFTRRVDGRVEAGPNAVLAFKREGYTRTSFSLRDSLSTVTFPGFWRLAGRYVVTGLGEMWRSWNKASFVKALQELMPAIAAADLVAGGAGVRAQALDAAGNLVDDFRIVEAERQIHVLNAPSPAATASIAIGRHIAAQALASFGLPPRRK